MPYGIRTVRAFGIVALVVLSVVGLQVAPVVLVDFEHDGLAQAGHIDGEVTYVGDNANDQVRAIYTDNQSTKWTYGRGGQDVALSPTGNIVYTAGDNGFAAIYAGNGSTKWTKSRSYAWSVAAVPGRDLVLGGDGDGNVYVLDAADGSTVRSSSPHGSNDRVYGVEAGVDGERFFTASQGGTAKGLYVDNASTYCSKSPADYVYGVSTGPNGEYWYVATDAGDAVRQYSTSDCANGWSSSLSSGGNDVVAGPNGNRVYTGAGDGRIDAYDVSDGSRVWSTTVNSNNDDPNVGLGPDGANVYVADDGGEVYALDSSDGSKKWEATNAINYAGGITAGGSISTVKNHLNGTVTDADGNPIDSATIEAVNRSTGSTEATTTTDANGHYEVALDSGTYDVTASKSGLSPTTKTVTVSGDTTLNFTLTSDTTITDPDPPDGATVSEPPVELSVLANTTNQSVQSIDVEFYEKKDGSSDTQIGSATVSPGDRATVTWDPPKDTYEWYAEGTADSGAQDTGGPYTLAIGEADIIDGTEQPPDGANVDPTADVDLAVDVRVDNDATVEFYDYETGNPDNDPLIGSQQVTSGTSTASARWYSNERDATEEWYVILKDSTGTRDTAGAFRFSAGGQVVARDAETGDIIDDRTVRFDTTYPGGSQTFDRSPGVLDLSEVDAEQNDRIRIDVRAKDYYERTVEVPDKQSDADIYLERGTNWSSNPSSDDPQDTANVDNDPDRYLSRFEIEDRTGRYPPSNTTLALRADMDGDGLTDLIHRESFGAANRVGAVVENDREYQLIIENDQGDRRRLGAWTAISDQLVQLQVRAFDFNIPEQGAGWASHASVEETDNDSEVFRWQFSDPSKNTSRLKVAIYERDNRSNGLLNHTYSDIGNVSYTQQLTGNQTGKAWVIELDGTRNGETFTSREVVGETDLSPGIPLDPFYQEMFAVLLLLVLAGVFGGIRAETGAIIVPMTAGVLFWMGWLPGVVTASAIAAALFVAVLYRLRSTPQPGVR